MSDKFYQLAQGGNQFAWPTDPIDADVTGYVNIRPAEHHQRRFYTIERHIDTGQLPFIGQKDEHIAVQTGDTFGTHFLGAPALLVGVSFHVRKGSDFSEQSGFKGAAAKLHPSFKGLNSDTSIALVDPITGAEAVVDLTASGKAYYFVPKPEVVTGSPNPDNGNTTITIPARKLYTEPLGLVDNLGHQVNIPALEILQPIQNVVVSIPPGAGSVGAPYLNQDEVLNLVHRYVSTIADDAPVGTTPPQMNACFGVVLHYLWLEDDHDCRCTPAPPCPATYPDPLCDVK